MNLQGKICLVTGSTDGIGEVTARELAANGAAVVFHGRGREKAEAVVERIRRETGNQNVEYLLADFASQDEVRRMAAEFKSKYDRLDILVNNAGAAFLNRQENDEGIEMSFAVNHLGPFLLTHLLLDMIKDSAPARIVNVASGAHLQVKNRVDDWNTERGYWVMKAYSRSKLANILFTYELAKRLEGTGVTVNALHPGFVRTSIFRRVPILGRLIDLVIGWQAITPEEGAQTNLYLATSPEVEGITGKYYYQKRQVRSSPVSHDEALARELWQLSERLVGLNGQEEIQEMGN